ncbi:hypothetical protein [Actinoplanes regularis]|uniref:hypothetical protein n=1 Tax=Actinoplanes regularis TaxID=52697 RepID=UPI0024A5946D|nr:hypothetical protein [Actinoplanes regularis]GLW33702.1 hypothetical protein Areg01_66400 [Actinoplanes regularis]
MDETPAQSRYRADAQLLARIGEHLAGQVESVTVRLPNDLAAAAALAWDRDETDPPGPESGEQAYLRSFAAALALLGLAVRQAGTDDPAVSNNPAGGNDTAGGNNPAGGSDTAGGSDAVVGNDRAGAGDAETVEITVAPAQLAAALFAHESAADGLLRAHPANRIAPG